MGYIFIILIFLRHETEIGWAGPNLSEAYKGRFCLEFQLILRLVCILVVLEQRSTFLIYDQWMQIDAHLLDCSKSVQIKRCKWQQNLLPFVAAHCTTVLTVISNFCSTNFVYFYAFHFETLQLWSCPNIMNDFLMTPDSYSKRKKKHLPRRTGDAISSR